MQKRTTNAWALAAVEVLVGWQTSSGRSAVAQEKNDIPSPAGTPAQRDDRQNHVRSDAGEVKHGTEISTYYVG